MAPTELEKQFGDTLHAVVVHLIKNAVRPPPPVLQGALAHESRTWKNFSNDEKKARVREIAELTEAPSAIYRHFESFPHAFGKEQYARYLKALDLYKAQLEA